MKAQEQCFSQGYQYKRCILSGEKTLKKYLVMRISPWDNNFRFVRWGYLEQILDYSADVFCRTVSNHSNLIFFFWQLHLGLVFYKFVQFTNISLDSKGKILKSSLKKNIKFLNAGVKSLKLYIGQFYIIVFSSP